MTWRGPAALRGFRGRFAATVFVVSAVIYSAAGLMGFVALSAAGRNAIESRVERVLDDLENGFRGDIQVTQLRTPDGVVAQVTGVGLPHPAQAGEVVVVRHVTRAGHSYDLVGSAATQAEYDALRRIHLAVWVAITLAAIISAAIASIVAKRALTPVVHITALAAGIDGADSEERIPVPATDDELSHLAHTFNGMLDRLGEQATAQRRFTSDAAHELRTPLMALQSEIELAARPGGGCDPELAVTLTRLAARLQQRVDDLLTLATLDEHRPLRLQRVDLAAVVRAEVTSVAPTATVDVEDGPVMAEVDVDLFGLAVRNVLANARQHGGRRVDVVVRGGADATVQVDDDGPGIPMERRTTVFDRFTRLDPSRSTGGRGAGLGLSITASVIAAHGGTASISDSPLGGARVTLTVPAARDRRA